MTEDHGGITVRRYERTPVEVVADVRDQLATATSDGVRPTLELAEVGFEPHRCLQVSPTARQASCGSRSPGSRSAPSSSATSGSPTCSPGAISASPALLDVEIAGRVVASAEAGVDDGWVRFAAPTTPGAADVTFVLRAAEPRTADLLRRRGAPMKGARRHVDRLEPRGRDDRRSCSSTSSEVGIARDEVVYMQNGARYAEWWLSFGKGRHRPRPSADRARPTTTASTRRS